EPCPLRETAMSSSTLIANVLVLATVLLVAPLGAAAAQVSRDTAGTGKEAGAIVDARACSVPFASYEDWVGFLRTRRGGSFNEAAFRSAYRPEIFARLQNGSIDCRVITYLSDGIPVQGFVVQPDRSGGRPLPAIIYNRGGNRDFGRITFANLMDFAAWAEQGFIVLASQHRGGRGTIWEDAVAR